MVGKSRDRRIFKSLTVQFRFTWSSLCWSSAWFGDLTIRLMLFRSRSSPSIVFFFYCCLFFLFFFFLNRSTLLLANTAVAASDWSKRLELTRGLSLVCFFYWACAVAIYENWYRCREMMSHCITVLRLESPTQNVTNTFIKEIWKIVI